VAVPGWRDAREARLATVAEAVGLPRAGKAGRPNSEQRRRFAARMASHLSHRLAVASGIRLAVRGRPGPEPNEVVVAFPWRRRGAAEDLGREVAELMAALLATRRLQRRLVEDAESS